MTRLHLIRLAITEEWPAGLALALMYGFIYFFAGVTPR
jgi:hypothetical protein